MALRFNGQSPTTVGSSFSSFPNRVIGTVSGLTLHTGMQPLWGARRAALTAFGELAGIPDGTTHPISWQMPNAAGRISSGYNASTFVPTAQGTRGLPTSGSIGITFAVDPAQLQLIVSTDGTTGITFTLEGNAKAVLDAVANIQLQFTVEDAQIGAKADTEGTSSMVFTATATPKALGNIEGSITPFTELSPQSLAQAVWSYQLP
jgi:hypothetical protein